MGLLLQEPGQMLATYRIGEYKARMYGEKWAFVTELREEYNNPLERRIFNPRKSWPMGNTGCGKGEFSSGQKKGGAPTHHKLGGGKEGGVRTKKGGGKQPAHKQARASATTRSYPLPPFLLLLYARRRRD